MATLLAMIMIFSGCGQLENQTKLIIGLDDHYAPMGFRDESGEIIGFDIDLAKEVAKRLAVEFEFKPIDWNKKIEELNSGNVDIIWNGLDVTDERKKYILFSKPYMDNRQILLVKAGDDHGIRSAGDLDGKIVGTQAGSNSEDYINANDVLKSSFADFKTYRNFKDAFAALESDKVDVLICDEIAARYEISKIPKKFNIIEMTIGPVTEIAVGFRKGDVELHDRVQKVFDDMIKDGTARKISERWFQADIIKYRR